MAVSWRQSPQSAYDMKNRKRVMSSSRRSTTASPTTTTATASTTGAATPPPPPPPSSKIDSPVTSRSMRRSQQKEDKPPQRRRISLQADRRRRRLIQQQQLRKREERHVQEGRQQQRYQPRSTSRSPPRRSYLDDKRRPSDQSLLRRAAVKKSLAFYLDDDLPVLSLDPDASPQAPQKAVISKELALMLARTKLDKYDDDDTVTTSASSTVVSLPPPPPKGCLKVPSTPDLAKPNSKKSLQQDEFESSFSSLNSSFTSTPQVLHPTIVSTQLRSEGRFALDSSVSSISHTDQESPFISQHSIPVPAKRQNSFEDSGQPLDEDRQESTNDLTPTPAVRQQSLEDVVIISETPGSTISALSSPEPTPGPSRSRHLPPLAPLRCTTPSGGSSRARRTVPAVLDTPAQPQYNAFPMTSRNSSSSSTTGCVIDNDDAIGIIPSRSFRVRVQFNKQSPQYKLAKATFNGQDNLSIAGLRKVNTLLINHKQEPDSWLQRRLLVLRQFLYTVLDEDDVASFASEEEPPFVISPPDLQLILSHFELCKETCSQVRWDLIFPVIVPDLKWETIMEEIVEDPMDVLLSLA